MKYYFGETTPDQVQFMNTSFREHQFDNVQWKGHNQCNCLKGRFLCIFENINKFTCLYKLCIFKNLYLTYVYSKIYKFSCHTIEKMKPK